MHVLKLSRRSDGATRVPTRTMMQCLGMVMMGVSLWLAGCAGTGETVSLSLRAMPPTQAETAPAAPPEKVLVLIPFEDAREDKGPLGVRTHLGGGVTHFDVLGGAPGTALARALADHLARKGRWVIVGGADAAAKASGSGAAAPQADVTLAGRLQGLSVHAKSRFGSTVITARMKIQVVATNVSDGSQVRLSREGEQSQTVFWFLHDDVQTVLDGLVTDVFEQLLTNVAVDGRNWVIKS